MTYTTLTYNGVEKTLADWGVSHWSRSAQNQGNDEFVLTLPVPMDGADIFPFGANIIIKINRTASAVNPINPTLPNSALFTPGLSFSGGTPWFWGYCASNDRLGEPGREEFQYKFAGPYPFFFQRTIFQKLMLTWNQNPAGGVPRNFADYQSDVVLGLSLTTLTGAGDTVQGSTATNLMSFAQQIKEICQRAQAASAAAYGSSQFQCDQLTAEVDGVNWDLLATPSANVLVKDYYGVPLSGQTSAVQSQLLAVPGVAPARPGTYILRPPLDAVNAVTCAEAMARVLQWLGGVGSPQVWTDHSQTPPQLHIATPELIATADPGTTTTPQRLGGGYILNLPLAGVTVRNRLKKRSDLVPSAVHFKYKVSGSVLGASFTVVINDIAAYINGTLYEGMGAIGSLYDVSAPTVLLPVTIQNALQAAALLPAAMVQTIDFQGAQVTGQQATITTTPINPVNPGGNHADNGWWQTLFPHFANTAGLTFFDPVNCPVTYTDPQTGAAVNVSGLNYRLPDGQLASWMTNASSPISARKVRVTAFFSYREMLPGKNVVAANYVSNKEEHVDITLTDAVSGTYSTVSGETAGEPIPYGLAGYILALESVPQYEGAITVQETEISDVCPLGNRLNLTGGLAEWATMAAQVQSVRYADNGQTEITIGPARHLGPSQFVARFRNNVGPRWYLLINANPLNTGSSGGENVVAPNVAMQAPSPGAKGYSFQALFGNLLTDQSAAPATLPAGVFHDAGAGDVPPGFGSGAVAGGQRPFAFAAGAFGSVWAAGAAGPTPGESAMWIRLHSSDMGGGAQQVYLREVKDCNNGVNGFRLVLCSQFYTTSIRSTPDP